MRCWEVGRDRARKEDSGGGTVSKYWRKKDGKKNEAAYLEAEHGVRERIQSDRT